MEDKKNPRSYRKVAVRSSQVEWLMRAVLDRVISDGAPPREVVECQHLAKAECEVTQEEWREFYDLLQNWSVVERRDLSKFSWIQTQGELPPHLTSADDNQEKVDEPKQKARKRRKKSGPPPESSGEGS